MADKNLVQQIDKISYAVAGVLGLAVLILPVLSGGNLAEKRQELNTASLELANKKQEQIFPPLPELVLEDEIQAQWKPGAGGESRTWVTEATPSLVKRARSIQLRPATHSAGRITEISSHRDSEKQQVYLVIKGAMGAENDFVVIERVELSRREGAEEFKPIGTFKGDFEYRDVRVKPGETYAYKFTTVASRDPGAPGNILDPEVTEQESAELETPAIPYDFSVKVRQFRKAQELGDVPGVMADFHFWDYAKGASEGEDRGNYEEKAVLGKRYMISRIDPAKRSITVKDSRWLERYDISSRDKPFDLELWPPVSGAVEEAAPDEAEEEEAPAAAADLDEPAEAPTKAPTRAPTPSTRRRPRF